MQRHPLELELCNLILSFDVGCWTGSPPKIGKETGLLSPHVVFLKDLFLTLIDYMSEILRVHDKCLRRFRMFSLSYLFFVRPQLLCG